LGNPHLEVSPNKDVTLTMPDGRRVTYFFTPRSGLWVLAGLQQPGYTGQQFDVLSGLYSLRARYYNPSDGRLLGRDLNEVDLNHLLKLNRYGYTANSPINRVDPSGNNLEETGSILGNIFQRVKPVLAGFGREIVSETLTQLISSNSKDESDQTPNSLLSGSGSESSSGPPVKREDLRLICFDYVWE